MDNITKLKYNMIINREGDAMKNLLNIEILHEPHFITAEHTHTVWEVLYYTHGTGILKIGDTKIPFKPGTIVCQPPNIPHSEASSKGFVCIYFLVGIFMDLNIPIPCFEDNEGMDVYNLLQQIYRVFHKKKRNWRNISETLLDAVCQYLISWNEKGEQNPLVECFENILLQNISNKNFKVNMAMKSIPLTTNHFRYLFKMNTGMTPLDYLTEKRINYAKYLLGAKHFNYTVKEIADRTGFKDQYYFSRVFKKVTGKSPINWISGDMIE